MFLFCIHLTHHHNSWTRKIGSNRRPYFSDTSVSVSQNFTIINFCWLCLWINFIGDIIHQYKHWIYSYHVNFLRFLNSKYDPAVPGRCRTRWPSPLIDEIMLTHLNPVNHEMLISVSFWQDVWPYYIFKYHNS